VFLNPARSMIPDGGCAVLPPPRFSATTPDVTGVPGRVRLPGWILIGSTGRKSGKTEFACAIIQAFHRRFPIVGIKVTVITEGESACPRGEQGCGVCSALEGDFQISEERGEQPNKDTGRMLESGAIRVFWLRCRRQGMHDALHALISRLGCGVLVVAESNSLAQVAEPDLFFMVKNGHSSSIKSTAAAVMPLAQRVVVSADRTFDLDPRQLTVVEGVWQLVETSMATFTGGKSSWTVQDTGILFDLGAGSLPAGPEHPRRCCGLSGER